MSFGIQCSNDSNELTLSSEGYLLSYLGKATRVATYGVSGDLLGYSVYTFTSSNLIVCAIGLKASGQSGAFVVGLSRSGTTWTITVVDLGTATETSESGGSFFVQRTDSDVYVFGLPAEPSFGAAIYNNAGGFAGDLLRTPLAVQSRIALGSGVMSTTVPAPIKPAIIGHPYSRHSNSVNTGSGSTPFINTRYIGSWHWDGATTISRTDVLQQYSREDGGGPIVTVANPTHAILVEANGLT